MLKALLSHCLMLHLFCMIHRWKGNKQLVLVQKRYQVSLKSAENLLAFLSEDSRILPPPNHSGSSWEVTLRRLPWRRTPTSSRPGLDIFTLCKGRQDPFCICLLGSMMFYGLQIDCRFIMWLWLACCTLDVVHWRKASIKICAMFHKLQAVNEVLTFDLGEPQVQHSCSKAGAPV